MQPLNSDHERDDVGLVDVVETCRMLGGNRPINRSTLYRGIKVGKYPAPLRLGPQTRRWLKREIVDVIDQLAAERRMAESDSDSCGGGPDV